MYLIPCNVGYLYLWIFHSVKCISFILSVCSTLHSLVNTQVKEVIEILQDIQNLEITYYTK